MNLMDKNTSESYPNPVASFGQPEAPIPAISLTPAQKWAEVVKLREMAWSLKRAAVRRAHPDWDEKRIARTVRDIFLYAST
jgi:hypothetical protein